MIKFFRKIRQKLATKNSFVSYSHQRTLIFLWFFLVLVGCQNERFLVLKEPLLGMEFIKIKKGSFLMGDRQNLNDSERIHEVHLTYDYWLGKTEVTQAQWRQLMGDAELHPEKPSPFRNMNPDFPIVSISYHDIELFLEKLNDVSTDYQFRLPTEAEWEYACRAGSKTPFSYGTKLTNRLANYNASFKSKYSEEGIFLRSPTPVGSYPANQWGLYDMHGNAWEWVSDWYAPYAADPVINPTGPDTGKEKIIRGGSWYFGAAYAKSSSRRIHEPQLWGFSIGFRLVCEKRNDIPSTNEKH